MTTQPYKVDYSDRVREHFVVLARTARLRGDGVAFFAALEEFDRRLHIYPQFGDPLSDLSANEGQLRVGIIAPLSMRYAVLEDERLVFVGALPVLLAKAIA